ncbi:MAG: DUF4347 domain-containing protein [Fimbriiglobus sp.]|jgi:hypothetical protein|nr:DUF4347 domain-containing protein [Fimbriiglobus sp.]
MTLRARLQLELLPDMVLPAGVVAIYDSQDVGYGPGTVTATGLQEAADDFTNHYGATDFDGLLAVVNGYVQNNGVIDQLYIFDHGNGTGQEFGNDIITSDQWGQIKTLLAPNAVIIFAGCSVGSNAQYNNDVAAKTGVPVIASDECVYYGYNPFGNDFASGGT